ncbi:putative transcription factor C2H2 family [Helianthus annuus]|uniref:Transcription factor C2H2 family n=1 Tax=Helianthus annuus TaxID=4232 RepID=A0A9K3JTF1_HELAN|nr:putative transcription factor C2H2 family [Helianthus annuus]
MGEVRLFIDFDDDQYLLYPSISSAEIIFCRICHEAEFESSKTMESPCSCSGTVKFAHRDCIQRWCDEKGNTTCEICLQVWFSSSVW